MSQQHGHESGRHAQGHWQGQGQEQGQGQRQDAAKDQGRSSGYPPQHTDWRSATDPKSGRTYYYNKKTKETTWNKPLDLSTPEERSEMIRIKNETMAFFKDMEANIKRRLTGEEIHMPSPLDKLPGISPPSFYDSPIISEYGKAQKLRGVRTISSMDDDVIHLARGVSSDPAKILYASCDSLERMMMELKGSPASGSTSSGTANSGSGTASHGGDSNGNGNGSTLRNLVGKEARFGLRADSPVSLSSNSSGEGRIKRTATAHEVGMEMDMGSGMGSGRMSPSKSSFGVGTHGNPVRRRRNSTGTLYLGSTMAMQDDEATIKCVCIVIRSHMIQAARDNIEPLPKYDIFKDAAYVNTNNKRSSETMMRMESMPDPPPTSAFFASSIAVTSGESARAGHMQGEAPRRNTVSKSSNLMSSRNIHGNGGDKDRKRIPSLREVQEFFKLIFSKSQLESECIIIALIYCERLVKVTKGRLCIRYDNYQSILFACLVMASKVWDDLSMWNVDFSQVCPSYNLQRINSLELAMLEELKFVIRVSASEYAKYYFHLRSMMARLGVRENEVSLLLPLNLSGARKLQLGTSKYQQDLTGPQRQRARTSEFLKDAGNAGDNPMKKIHSTDEYMHPSRNSGVILEQLLHEGHNDADGEAHVSHKMRRYTELPKETQQKFEEPFRRASDSMISFKSNDSRLGISKTNTLSSEGSNSSSRMNSSVDGSWIDGGYGVFMNSRMGQARPGTAQTTIVGANSAKNGQNGGMNGQNGGMNGQNGGMNGQNGGQSQSFGRKLEEMAMEMSEANTQAGSGSNGSNGRADGSQISSQQSCPTKRSLSQSGH